MKNRVVEIDDNIVAIEILYRGNSVVMLYKQRG